MGAVSNQMVYHMLMAILKWPTNLITILSNFRKRNFGLSSSTRKLDKWSYSVIELELSTTHPYGIKSRTAEDLYRFGAIDEDRGSLENDTSYYWLYNGTNYISQARCKNKANATLQTIRFTRSLDMVNAKPTSDPPDSVKLFHVQENSIDGWNSQNVKYSGINFVSA